jgi:hypothetical protein
LTSPTYYCVSDSLAFGATARHVYGVVNDAEHQRKLVVRAKNNLASASRADKALAYRFGLRQVGIDPENKQEIWAPHVIWESQYVDVTAAEAMQAQVTIGHRLHAMRPKSSYRRSSPTAPSPRLKLKTPRRPKAFPSERFTVPSAS